MTPARQPDDALKRAAESAGRAAGYCWAEHPTRGLRCTWPPNHQGDHRHTYTRTEWKK